jgi:2-polyprenyl-6-methoxyphenol hydroxylase-like FAD-dependent oxidoreductase
MSEADVIVVGAGPVGLTLAMCLATSGVAVTVIEQRGPAEAPDVRCNHVSSRSMELFRRLGVAGKVRAAGLPDDHPHDVAFRTTFIGYELDRIAIPGRRDRAAGTGRGPDGDWATPEPPHRVNQLMMEPVLFDHATSMDRVTILNGMRVDAVNQDHDGTTVSATELRGGARRTLRSTFLVGCDGGRSTVRRACGIALQGDDVVQRAQSSVIRAPGLLALAGRRPAWGTIVLNRRRSGTIYAIDGRETFLVHNYLRPDEAGFDAVDRDAAIRTILGVEDSFPYTLVSRQDWYGRRLIADRFRDRRVFLAGDAAHIWVPYAGYGMNAGIADAANLAWLLAAHLQGWAPAAILDAYEAERLPITEQVSRYAMAHAEAMIANRAAIPDQLEDDGPDGERARAAYGRAMVQLNVPQYCCAGLSYGPFYDRSPLIVGDGEPAPPYTMGTYRPSTVPGCRLPHVWRHDGASLYDRLGEGYTVLRFSDGADPAPLLAAARRRGIPFTAIDMRAEPPIPDRRHGLLVVRTDQHIAWRGDRVPADVDGLLDQLIGAAPG